MLIEAFHQLAHPICALQSCLMSRLGKGLSCADGKSNQPPNPVQMSAAGGAHGSYLVSGRWLADARTLAAAVRYLLEPEPKPAQGWLTMGGRPTGPVLQAEVQDYPQYNYFSNRLEGSGALTTNRPVKI